jgi:glutaredoxin
MTKITIYTTPSEFCARLTRLFDARGLTYTVVTLDTNQALQELTSRTGRKSCPLVFVGDALVGGQSETIEALQSGRLAALLETAETPSR